MTMKDAFHWFVFNFGNYDALLHSGLSGIDAPVMDGIIAIIVQFVYCWRVWVLSKWRVFPAFIALVSWRFSSPIRTQFSLRAITALPWSRCQRDDSRYLCKLGAFESASTYRTKDSSGRCDRLRPRPWSQPVFYGSLGELPLLNSSYMLT